jgi:IS5 family transposase
MLRVRRLRQWFNLSDSAAEEALDDARAMSNVAGIGLYREPLPDEPTICKFRHLLEAGDLGPRMLEAIDARFVEKIF